MDSYSFTSVDEVLVALDERSYWPIPFSQIEGVLPAVLHHSVTYYPVVFRDEGGLLLRVGFHNPITPAQDVVHVWVEGDDITRVALGGKFNALMLEKDWLKEVGL